MSYGVGPSPLPPASGGSSSTHRCGPASTSVRNDPREWSTTGIVIPPILLLPLVERPFGGPSPHAGPMKRISITALIALAFALPLQAGTKKSDPLVKSLLRQAPGLRAEVLRLALEATHRAADRGLVKRQDLLTVIDYSLPSSQPRLFVFDLAARKLLFRELVAHGKNSGDNHATFFSNSPGSLATSLGLFVTADPYVGSNGYSLRLKGLEEGINDMAWDRAIVMHGAAYPALPCAPAPHAGEQISVVEESAVIVWEPATKTQHFIRRATFRGTAQDFGFLVPTPTAPALAEVDDQIFDVLDTKTARQTVYKTRRAIDWTPLLLYSRLKREGMATAGRPPVEVLETKKIAGYEAAVLDATDAAALSRWLGEHGYATTPDLAEWLDAYVKQGWKITAFKIDKSADAMARTSAVKMSFRTERPFFPYREPASQRANAKYDDVRVLRIWFLG